MTESVENAKRNESERNRVKLLNEWFAKLKAVLPKRPGEMLNKSAVLRRATWYINHMNGILQEETLEEQHSLGTENGEPDTGKPLNPEPQEIKEDIERLSPIFPPRMDETNTNISSTSPSDSGCLNGSSQTFSQLVIYPPPPPAQVFVLTADEISMAKP